ncbi:MAG: carbamoyltransferase [Streptosporangiales bacterium]|nr:carbamoyltransferase [Streptosporangiales bacterium]
MRVLGINAIFHDPAAALVVDGQVVAAAEEERFTRRKHGKRPVPFSAWELPEQSARWCMEHAGLGPEDLDAVAYSYDPDLVRPGQEGLDERWEDLRTTYARRASAFLQTALPGLDPGILRHVPHHVAHAASAGLAMPPDARGDRDCAVLVLDGRGESASHLAGWYRNGALSILAAQELPHSLGLMYEDVTAHLGFARSSDEYKVMALASYGKPRFLDELRDRIRVSEDGGFVIEPVEWSGLAKRREPGAGWSEEHADLAASVQVRLEEVLLDLVRWLYERTGAPRLALAGGVALNCVANSRIAGEGPFTDVWVQPAASDAGTALGGALHLARDAGDETEPMPGVDLGRGWTDTEIERWLTSAGMPHERPRDLADAVARALAEDQIVAWFQGREEFGPRALGHRSLLAHPGRAENLERLNAVKGREQFRPIAPMVRADRAGDVFARGPLPSPYMLFVHDVRQRWHGRLPAITHVDGTARIQTVEAGREPLLARMLERFEARTGLPAVVNTSLNTAGRPMVGDPRDALECFGSAPIDVLAIGPYLVRRGEAVR